MSAKYFDGGGLGIANECRPFGRCIVQGFYQRHQRRPQPLCPFTLSAPTFSHTVKLCPQPIDFSLGREVRHANVRHGCL
jgi:hypothetical protein